MGIQQCRFSKEEIKALIQTCQKMISIFIKSNATINIKYNRMEQIIHTIMSWECLFAYLYSEVYDYGEITDVVNTKSDVYGRYTLTASLVFTEPTAMRDFIKRLPVSIDKVSTFVNGLDFDKNNKLEADINDYIRIIGDNLRKIKLS